MTAGALPYDREKGGEAVMQAEQTALAVTVTRAGLCTPAQVKRAVIEAYMAIKDA